MDEVPYRKDCYWCTWYCVSSTEQETRQYLENHIKEAHRNLWSNFADVTKITTAPLPEVKQRVIFWLHGMNEARQIDMSIESVAALLEAWKDDEITTLQVTTDDGVIFDFNKRHVIMLEISDLV